MKYMPFTHNEKLVRFTGEEAQFDGFDFYDKDGNALYEIQTKAERCATHALSWLVEVWVTDKETQKRRKMNVSVVCETEVRAVISAIEMVIDHVIDYPTNIVQVQNDLSLE